MFEIGLYSKDGKSVKLGDKIRGIKTGFGDIIEGEVYYCNRSLSFKIRGYKGRLRGLGHIEII